MTPKEKAKELVERFKIVRLKEGKSKLTDISSKRCALICVYEINNALQNIPDLQVIGNVLLDQIKYYQEVKQEIMNLQNK